MRGCSVSHTNQSCLFVSFVNEAGFNIVLSNASSLTPKPNSLYLSPSCILSHTGKKNRKGPASCDYHRHHRYTEIKKSIMERKYVKMKWAESTSSVYLFTPFSPFLALYLLNAFINDSVIERSTVCSFARLFVRLGSRLLPHGHVESLGLSWGRKNVIQSMRTFACISKKGRDAWQGQTRAHSRSPSHSPCLAANATQSKSKY